MEAMEVAVAVRVEAVVAVMERAVERVALKADMDRHPYMTPYKNTRVVRSVPLK